MDLVEKDLPLLRAWVGRASVEVVFDTMTDEWSPACFIGHVLHRDHLLFVSKPEKTSAFGIYVESPITRVGAVIDCERHFLYKSGETRDAPARRWFADHRFQCWPQAIDLDERSYLYSGRGFAIQPSVEGMSFFDDEFYDEYEGIRMTDVVLSQFVRMERVVVLQFVEGRLDSNSG